MEKIHSNIIDTLGFDELLKVFNLIKNLQIPIVSVGSKTGKLEYELDLTLNSDIICVDDSEQTSYYKKPHYSSVEEMDLPYFNNKCILFLNWSDDSGNDIEAVKLLEPLHIIIVTDLGRYRCASSVKMHHFMFDFGVDTDGNKKFTGPGTFIPDTDNMVDFVTDKYTLNYSFHRNQWIKGYEHPLVLSFVLLSTSIKNNSPEKIDEFESLKLQKVRSFERLERSRKESEHSLSPRFRKDKIKKHCNDITIVSLNSLSDEESPLFIPDDETLKVLENHKFENEMMKS
jgi:hypothetical protein